MPRCLVVDVDPGTHKVACQAESNSEITLSTGAGQVAYVWQEMKMRPH